MVSFDVRRASRLTAGAPAILALALSSTISAQPDSQQNTAASLQDEIRATQLRDGEHSADLIGPLTALGVIYQETGEPFLAAAALREAVQVVRVNYGLHSLEQAPLIRQMIANAESIGDHRGAWDLDQGLLKLAARHPNDPRTAEIFHFAADRRMDLLVRYNAGERPPEIVLGCYYEPSRTTQGAGDVAHEKNCTAGMSHNVREGLLTEARAYYVQAVDIILRNERYSSEELPTLLMDLVRSSYQYGNSSLGRRSLIYLLAYEASNSDDWLRRAETLAQIADWDLLHAVGRDEERSALAEYAEAYRLLAQHGIAQESIQRIFSPATPIVLPAFLPNPLATEEGQASTARIDVAFEIDRYGRGRHVRIVDRSNGMDKDDAMRLVEKRLVALLSRARFRPRFADGQASDTGPIDARYYFDPFDVEASRWSLYWAPTRALEHGEFVGRRSTNE